MHYGESWMPGTVIQEDPLEYDRSVNGYMVRLENPRTIPIHYWGEAAKSVGKTFDTVWSSEEELRYDTLAQLASL